MKTRFLLFSTLILSFSFLFQNCSSETSTTEATSTLSETTSENVELTKQSIAPPIQGVDVGFNSFEIKTSKSQTLKLDNGTSIEIPENAFVDANGNIITESVNVNYREFHDAASVLLSGIPMKASFNGVDGDMQTAGMFEIQATSNNQEVFLADGKDITVNMASNVDGDNYDFWLFDKEKGDWDNKGVTAPKPNLKKQEAKSALAKLNKIQAPAKPVKFDKTKPVLNFDINVESFPELKEMKNIFWQYAGKGENPQNAKWIFQEKWATADIKKGKKGNDYVLVLKSDNRNFSTTVCASQSGKEFEKSLETYDQQMKEYKATAMSKDEKTNFMKRQADFIRSMKINKMGIYNYDILLKNDENLLFAANFDFGSNSKVNSKVNVYLITNDSRSVVAFPYAQRDRFGINPNVDNRLIAILPNNKIATFSQQDFDDYIDDIREANGDAYTFKMKVEDAPVNKVGDLQQAIAAL